MATRAFMHVLNCAASAGWAGNKTTAAARRTYSELASLRGHLNMNAQYAGDQPNCPRKERRNALRMGGWRILSVRYVRVTARSPLRGWDGLLARHGSFDHSTLPPCGARHSGYIPARASARADNT